jgi:hypothetical protein
MIIRRCRLEFVILLVSKRRIFQDLIANTIGIIIVTAFLPIVAYGQLQHFTNQIRPSNQYGAYLNAGITNSSAPSNKVVILSFDDNRKGDFTYAKPILDKYGFKAIFLSFAARQPTAGR